MGVSFGDHPKVIRTLKIGDEVHLVNEPTNEHDEWAIKLETCSNKCFGYVPRDLAASVHAGKGFGVSFTVCEVLVNYERTGVIKDIMHDPYCAGTGVEIEIPVEVEEDTYPTVQHHVCSQSDLSDS